MLYGVLVIGLLVCAVLAVRATRLLSAALWLAGVSVFTAILLYLIGAMMMAVIELSLSVGLITILLVFAISMAGADSPDQPVTHPVYPLLTCAVFLLIIGLGMPRSAPQITHADASFTATFWDARLADVFAQIALIFAGVLGVLGLLAEPRSPTQPASAAKTQLAPEEDILDTAPLLQAKPEPELEQV